MISFLLYTFIKDQKNLDNWHKMHFYRTKYLGKNKNIVYLAEN